MLTQFSRFSGKTRALLLDRGYATARVSHKVASWVDRLTPRGALPDVRSASEVDRVIAHLVCAAQPLTGPLTSSLEIHIAESRRRLSAGPFPIDGQHNGTATLGRLCYLLCRHQQPRKIVETERSARMV